MVLDRIFISHEHEDSRIALALEVLFKSFFNAQVLYSTSKDSRGAPEPGSNWQEWIQDAAGSAETIFVLRRKPSDWMLFEMGAVASRAWASKDRIRATPLLFGLSKEKLPPQLSQHQAADGDTVDGIRSLLQTWTRRYSINTASDYMEDRIVRYCETIKKSVPPPGDHLETALAHFEQARWDICKATMDGSEVFRHAVNVFASDVSSISRAARHGSQLEVPSIRYPKYLLALQGNRRRVIRAIALVGDVEHFWRDRIGSRIAAEAHPDSRRVFVFRDKETFKNHFDILLRHAEKYRVRVLQYDALVKESGGYSHDFSIIQDATEATKGIVATYADRDTLSGDGRNIALSAEPNTLSEYSSAFEHIWSRARDIRRDGRSAEAAESLAEEVFGPIVVSIRPMPRRTIEMSRYVNPQEYDQHEEKHAYYQDMMAKLAECVATRSAGRKVRVLELGAGTGLFTKRLLDIPNVAELHAIELDWACFKCLERKFKSEPTNRLKLHFEDSRTYNAEGEFDFIVTSFSDHHISEEDKRAYFLNVRNNLRQDALFLVGDEFLREPVLADQEEERRKALEAYHSHIIGIAEAQGEHQLAALERAALKSGLERAGDFKLPLSAYEAAVAEVGFEVVDKVKLGPLGGEDVGGVYAVTMRFPGRATS